MRLQKFINEGTTASLQDLLITTFNNCKPILKYYESINNWDAWMYSGRAHREPYYEGLVRTDRLPKDMKMAIHQTLDDAYEEVFGWRARSESVFVSGDLHQASHYGNVYIILPMGNYRFAYNVSVRDQFEIMNHIGGFEWWAKNEIRQNPIWKDEVEKFKKEHDDMDDSDIRYASVMDVYKKNEKKLRQMYNNLFVSVVKGYTDKDLLKGIKSKVEIMLNCKKYLAVNYDYKDALNLWYTTQGMATPKDEVVREWAIKNEIDDHTFMGLKIMRGNIEL